MTLEDEFNKAIDLTKTFNQRPSNEVLLKLYALYKQATMGDNPGEKPAVFDIKALAKFNAWESLKGKSREESMREYIELVHSLD
jgi:acyl-CoA-binding protein